MMYPFIHHEGRCTPQGQSRWHLPHMDWLKPLQKRPLTYESGLAHFSLLMLFQWHIRTWSYYIGTTKSDTPIDMVSFPFKIYHYLQPSQSTEVASPHHWGSFLGATGTFRGSRNGQRLEGGKVVRSPVKWGAFGPPICYKKVIYPTFLRFFCNQTPSIHARYILEILEVLFQ